MLSQHRELFAQYWRWSDDWVQHALQTGVMRTAFGWTCRTGITEFNERSIRNWPIQATGADILRIACILATRHGIKLAGACTRRGADRGADRADRSRRRADARDHAAGVADRAQCRRRRHARAAHRLQDHPLPGALQRPSAARKFTMASWLCCSLVAEEVRVMDDWAKQRLEELEAAAPVKRADDRLIGCPVAWLLRVLPVVRSPKQLVVAIWLWRRRVVCGNRDTFSVPNGELERWGISRQAKYRALGYLVAAGVIAEPQLAEPAGSLVVTILPEKQRNKRRR